MNFSYVMGIGDCILSLEKHNFTIERDGDNFMVSFPKEQSSTWEEFISQNLPLGYWNEYLQDGVVVFLFSLEDGIKRYEVYSYQNDEVLSLCEQLCQCKFQSIYSMLKGNHFYSKHI